MPSLFFTFTAGSGEQDRAALLDRLRRSPGVSNSAKLSPESNHQEISRMGFIEVDSEADSDRLLAVLRREPIIETADPPADRRLT